MTKDEAKAMAAEVIEKTDADLDTSEGLGQLASELEERFDNEAAVLDDEEAEEDGDDKDEDE